MLRPRVKFLADAHYIGEGFDRQDEMLARGY
jgi:hypothetical protein